MHQELEFDNQLILRKIIICTIKSGKTILLHYETGIYKTAKYTNLIRGCRDVTGRTSLLHYATFMKLRSIPTGNPDRGADVRNNIALQFAVPAPYTASLKHVYILYFAFGKAAGRRILPSRNVSIWRGDLQNGIASIGAVSHYGTRMPADRQSA